MSKRYFHEQSYEQMKHLTFNAVKRWFSQPDWCNYPNALDSLGCWGLTFGYVVPKAKSIVSTASATKKMLQPQLSLVKKAKVRKGVSLFQNLKAAVTVSFDSVTAAF